MVQCFKIINLQKEDGKNVAVSVKSQCSLEANTRIGYHCYPISLKMKEIKKRIKNTQKKLFSPQLFLTMIRCLTIKKLEHLTWRKLTTYYFTTYDLGGEKINSPFKVMP